jgi:hypothetical protein
LGEEEFDAASEAGRMLSVVDAVAEAHALAAELGPGTR